MTLSRPDSAASRVGWPGWKWPCTSSSAIRKPYCCASTSSLCRLAALLPQPVGLCSVGLQERQARLVLAAGGLHLRQVDAVVAARDRQHADALLLQPAEHQEVAGILDQHGVAGLEEAAADHVDRVRAAVGREDAAGVDGDARAAQHQRDALAQLGHALRRAARSHAGRRCARARAAPRRRARRPPATRAAARRCWPAARRRAGRWPAARATPAPAPRRPRARPPRASRPGAR